MNCRLCDAANKTSQKYHAADGEETDRQQLQALQRLDARSACIVRPSREDVIQSCFTDCSRPVGEHYDSLSGTVVQLKQQVDIMTSEVANVSRMLKRQCKHARREGCNPSRERQRHPALGGAIGRNIFIRSPECPTAESQKHGSLGTPDIDLEPHQMPARLRRRLSTPRGRPHGDTLPIHWRNHRKAQSCRRSY